ncbi:MAG: hypothetical protein KAR05_08455 [Candidatus Omnitrophica bacterium]|nr:hypothetical protein [Candidatus Omnitrophota bacterium]
MLKNKMNRKEFLGRVALFVSGIALLPFQKLFSHPKGIKRSHIKEAKYFRSGDHLAG